MTKYLTIRVVLYRFGPKTLGVKQIEDYKKDSHPLAYRRDLTAGKAGRSFTRRLEKIAAFRLVYLQLSQAWELNVKQPSYT